jgi:hypothetical protein
VTERGDRGLDRTEHRDRLLAVREETTVASDDDGDDRLAVRCCRRDRGRDCPGIGDQRRRMDDDECIDAGILGNGRDCRLVRRRCRVAEQVDRVRGRRRG